MGGWQLSTIGTLQSGTVIDTTSGWDSGGVAFVPNSDRLDCVAGVNPVFDNRNQNAWLNPAAFRNPLGGTFGNCGRNNLRGPRRVNFDFSVTKDFRIFEKQALQFRMEMFNSVNHVELGAPNASWSGSGAAPPSNFGQITNAATMRQIQMALKYNF